tara:strand:- start:316 stop:456 length:141 start_codon:yes stop_codon:yes gene_type:complete
MKSSQKIAAIFAVLVILALSACSAKKGGKGCDCPSFGQIEKTEHHS